MLYHGLKFTSLDCIMENQTLRSKNSSVNRCFNNIIHSIEITNKKVKKRASKQSSRVIKRDVADNSIK